MSIASISGILQKVMIFFLQVKPAFSALRQACSVICRSWQLAVDVEQTED